MRERFLEDQPVSRRRARSDAEARGSQQHPYDTKDGAKARQIDLERRVADLERDWKVPMDDQEGGGGAPVIDLGDGAVPTGHSKPWYFTSKQNLRSVVAALTVAGTTDTVMSILKNGSSIGTLTISAGDLSGEVSLGDTFDEGDLWQVQVTSAGTGAGGLTCYGVVS